MGLPALQQFEHLSAAVEARSDVAARAGEVVSFALGDLIKSVNAVIGDIDSLRSIMIEARLALSEVTIEEARRETVDRLARVRVTLRRFARLISYPMLARPHGYILVRLAEVLEQAEPSRVADARVMRKLARRVREHAERCEVQRLRLHARSSEALGALEGVASESEHAAEHEEALMAALATAARNRHPVINAYLGR